MRLKHIRRWPPAWKAFLSACCCKNESESGFLAVTSSWDTKIVFQLKLANFLATQLLSDFVANNLINFQVIETSLRLLLWVFEMENNEILGFQFEPTNAFQTDSSSSENWETCSWADSEPSTTTRSLLSISWYLVHVFKCIQMLTTRECLCYHELNACEYFKIKNFFFLYLISFFGAG